MSPVTRNIQHAGTYLTTDLGVRFSLLPPRRRSPRLRRRPPRSGSRLGPSVGVSRSSSSYDVLALNSNGFTPRLRHRRRYTVHGTCFTRTIVSSRISGCDDRVVHRCILKNAGYGLDFAINEVRGDNG